MHLHRQPVHERGPKAEQQVGGGACLSREGAPNLARKCRSVRLEKDRTAGPGAGWGCMLTPGASAPLIYVSYRYSGDFGAGLIVKTDEMGPCLDFAPVG